MLGKIALASVAIVGLTTVASADGYQERGRYYAPAYSWSGIYLGGSLGGIWGDIQHDHYSEAVAPGPFVLSPSFSGGTYGGHVGIQHQFHGGLVIGAELSYKQLFQAAKASEVCPPPIAADSTCNQHISRLTTIGPRVGWASHTWLFYASGGYAVGTLSSDYTFTSTGLPRFPGFQGHSTNDGWFAGGGVEYALLPNVILGLDYQHYDLDSKRATTQLSATNNDNIALASTGDVISARLSYKFGRTDDRRPLK